MDITFISADQPLTKTYTLMPDGSITKSAYPNVYEVSTHTEKIKTLKDFEKQLIDHAAKRHCLLKGNPNRPLVNESRADNTDRNESTQWICLDVDGIPDCTAEEFMKAIKMSDVSHIVQYSASYGIENDDLKCHIFLFADREQPAPLLKQWLIQINHATPILSKAMTLTKTGNALHWPLDITACQSDKLLYITPPILKGIRHSTRKRIELIQGTYETVAFTTPINSTAQNRTLTDKRVAELRDAGGYPARKVTMKMHGTTEVMNKPDVCTLTGTKTERGFVYFNLNGGDSWGYYHSENDPEFIHNFKGEPSYLTKELLPEYWQSLQQSASAERSDGTTYLAFCDKATSIYWRGTHDAETNTLDIYPTKSALQLRDFAKQHGMPLGDFIPEWDLVFDPHDSVRVDPTHRIVNMYQPTSYMLATPKPVKTCPKLIHRVIHHALGEDDAITDRFINWVAYILQYKDRARTAWVLHGSTGTGKGVIGNKILRPIFGNAHTAMRRLEEFNQPYNDFLDKCFLVFVDEVETKTMQNEKGVMAKIKNFITEEHIVIRRMHTSPYEVRNHSSWIFNSNKTDPVLLDREDRRFNIAAYQPDKLGMSQQEIDQIETELQAFHDYLHHYKVDTGMAHTPMLTNDREVLMSISEVSVDTVVGALLAGDFNYFIESLPTTDAYQSNMLSLGKVLSYKDVLTGLIARTDKSGAVSISRDELHTLLEYTIGGMPQTPNKFTSLLKHHRIHLGVVWADNKSVRGIKVTWKDYNSFPEYVAMISPPAVITKLKAVK